MMRLGLLTLACALSIEACVRIVDLTPPVDASRGDGFSPPRTDAFNPDAGFPVDAPHPMHDALSVD
jgi:hypothetical protein